MSKTLRIINNELIEIAEYKNPRIVFNDYKLENIENYCVFKETINPFQLYKELQRKDNNWNELKKYVEQHNECWELEPILDKIKELENDN